MRVCVCSHLARGAAVQDRLQLPPDLGLGGRPGAPFCGAASRSKRRRRTGPPRSRRSTLERWPLAGQAAGADGSPTAAAQPHAVAAARRRVRKPEKTSPPNHCCEKRDEDKCPQLHSCVSCEHRVCRDRTGQANPSARTADPVQCYPFLAFLWSYSVVKGGGDQLSGVHMSDGARTRFRPNVPRSRRHGVGRRAESSAQGSAGRA